MTSYIRHWQIICLLTAVLFCFPSKGFSAKTNQARQLFTNQIELHYPMQLDEIVGFQKPTCILSGATCPVETTASKADTDSSPPSESSPLPALVDRFSVEEFARFSFTPSCLFADENGNAQQAADSNQQKVSHIYEVNFDCTRHSDDLDLYWEYYDDCDQWGVVFAEIQPQAYEVNPGLLDLFHTFLDSTIDSVASIEFDSLANSIEFYLIETFELNQVTVPTQPGIPVKSTIIETLKQLRPMLRGLFDHGFVRNPYIWLKELGYQVEMEISGTVFMEVWNDFANTQLIGPLPTAVTYSRKASTKAEDSVKSSLMHRFHWIASQLTEVLQETR